MRSHEMPSCDAKAAAAEISVKRNEDSITSGNMKRC